MKLSKVVMVILLTVLCFGLGCKKGDSQGQQDTQAVHNVQEAVKDPAVKVLNPLGTPPPIKLIPMAPRLDTLEGKTIYVDNNGYPGTSILLPELIAVMKEKYPNTRFIYNDKPAGSIAMNQDPAMGEADALIIATGH